jgi:hypothetical protein
MFGHRYPRHYSFIHRCRPSCLRDAEKDESFWHLDAGVGDAVTCALRGECAKEKKKNIPVIPDPLRNAIITAWRNSSICTALPQSHNLPSHICHFASPPTTTLHSPIPKPSRPAVIAVNGCLTPVAEKFRKSRSIVASMFLVCFFVSAQRLHFRCCRLQNCATASI